MNTCTVWIVVQQDGQHLLEYDLLTRSVFTNRKGNTNIRYIIYHYEQQTGLATVKTLYKDQEGVLSFINTEGPVSAALYEPDTLISFFKKYSEPSMDFASDHNIVIFWSHGSGLGYFNSDDDKGTKTYYFKGLDLGNEFDPDSKWLANTFVNYFTFIGSNGSVEYEAANDLFQRYKEENLLKPDVAGIIDKSFKILGERRKYISAKQMSRILKDGLGRKADLVISNTCYSQMLESVYFFRDSVKIMVGPQTVFPFLGYDFNSFFSKLENSADFKPLDLAEDLKSSFRNKYASEPFKSILSSWYQTNTDGLISGVSFSTINLDFFNNDFFSVMNDLGETIDSFFKIKFNDIDLNNTRDACMDLTGNKDSTIVIDLTNFLEEFSSRKKTEPLTSQLLKYRKFLVADSLRINHLPLTLQPEEISKKGNPNFLSFFMLHFTGIPNSIKPFVLGMLELTYQNKEFATDFEKWAGFINNWIRHHPV